MLRIKLNSNVQCKDGFCGKLTNIILVPLTKKVTHIAVKNEKLPDNATRLVSINHILSATQTQVNLDCTIEDITLMPPFTTIQFVQETALGKVDSLGSDFLFPDAHGQVSGEKYSVVVNNTAFDAVDVKNIPDGELSLANEMEIHALDGKIGKLDELDIDENGVITHILMLEGYLWGKKERQIPVSEVTSAKFGSIILKLNKKSVQALPSIPLKR